MQHLKHNISHPTKKYKENIRKKIRKRFKYPIKRFIIKAISLQENVNMERMILHSDINACYASIELLRHPGCAAVRLRSAGSGSCATASF